MVAPSQDFFLVCLYPVSTMNLQIRGYSQQYSLSGMKAHASNHWMIFRITTSLNSSPLLVWRHDKRKNVPFLNEVFSITRLSPWCLKVGNAIQVVDPRTGSFKLSKILVSIVHIRYMYKKLPINSSSNCNAIVIVYIWHKNKVNWHTKNACVLSPAQSCY